MKIHSNFLINHKNRQTNRHRYNMAHLLQQKW